MGKKNKKMKIPKNKDIEEIVDREERKLKKGEIKKQEFKEKIKVSNKKIQNVFERKDAQMAETKRKEILMKAINKVQEKEER